LEWFTKCFIPESGARLCGEYRLMIFDGHSSHISSAVIRACVANKIILLCLPPHTTHLLQPLDIGLFAPLASYYKSEIRDSCKFGYNYLIDKLVFLEAYLKARDKAFTVTNIQKAWVKSGLHPFLPSLVIDQLPPLLPSGSGPQPSSRPSTPGGPVPILIAKTPANVNEIRQVLKLGRKGQLEDPQLALAKVCKAAEKAMAERLILGNHNTELQEAAARKKERNSRKGENLSKADARVYDADSLAERALWRNEQYEEELLKQFMKLPLTIFDFKEKKPRKKPPLSALDTTHLGSTPSLTTLFQSPVKGGSPSKTITHRSPIKASISSKVKNSGVKKRGRP
jgi:hypothetical protein